MMNKINLFLLLIFFSFGVKAQKNPEKKIRNEYPAIMFDPGTITLKKSPFGFYIESDISSVEKITCEKSLHEVVNYLYFFLRSVKQRQELREKCSNYKLGKNYFSSDYEKGANEDLENILRYYFKQKNRRDLTIENYFQVIQKLESYKKSIVREVLLLHWHFYFNRLDNVRIHLKKVLSHDMYEYLVHLDYRKERKIINDKDGRIRLSQVVDELLTLSSSRLENVIFHSMINFLNKFEWSEVSPEIHDKIVKLADSPDTDDLSKYIKDFRWGKSFPHVWGRLVLNKMGEDGFEKFLTGFWRIPEGLKNKSLISPYLEYLFNPQNRNQVLEHLVKLRKSNESHSKRYFYDFVGSSVLGGKRLNDDIVIPARTFQDKRNFYNDLFKTRKWTLFSLFQLISLGDLKVSHINEL